MITQLHRINACFLSVFLALHPITTILNLVSAISYGKTTNG